MRQGRSDCMIMSVISILFYHTFGGFGGKLGKIHIYCHWKRGLIKEPWNHW